ncbi:HEAT repeat domain-containing protein [Caloramator sp. mosi_1]|uniref:HEAT repeat domain-containing protein n=1 Tax=Caloramator sp. mosi_1 TaxID=3023090 RepID=UPI00235F2ECC|nr:HEAT repeat domain-containing protein [Caloramator sp. mosi_1]WDC83649.1 HEAT repeat domain-containing protein [Caloramator sp. mosi_1]
MTFLKCTDGNIKRICCSSLGKIEAKESEDALISVLTDKRPQVKQYAIKALGKIKSKSQSNIYKIY